MTPLQRADATLASGTSLLPIFEPAPLLELLSLFTSSASVPNGDVLHADLLHGLFPSAGAEPGVGSEQSWSPYPVSACDSPLLRPVSADRSDARRTPGNE